jgi:hypothetical protein
LAYLFWKVFYAFDVLKIGIFRPNGTLIGSRGCQNDAVGHGKIVAQAQLGSLHGEIGGKVDNPAFLHRGNGLKSAIFGGLPENDLENCVDGYDRDNQGGRIIQGWQVTIRVWTV